VAQIFSRSLGSHFISPYSPRGCDGGILTCHHTGRLSSKSKLFCYRRSVGQYVLVSDLHLGLATNLFSRAWKFSINSWLSIIKLPPLTKLWTYNLQFVLALASALFSVMGPAELRTLRHLQRRGEDSCFYFFHALHISILRNEVIRISGRGGL
jgi:hypothetical protein